MIRVAILISGGGSNMVALVNSMTGNHPARPCLVLSNKPGAGGLARATALGVAAEYVDHTAFDSRPEFELALQTRLEAHGADILCLAGFMRILSPWFTAQWAGRCLNIHPSLLPDHPGLDTHARALAAGDREHGCTVHEVTEILDQGPILGQARLSIHGGETAEELAARVLPLEHRLYPAVLRRYAAGDRSPVLIDETAA